MASNFHIQKPYVLTHLPQPLNSTKGSYVVGEVFGQRAGTKKRKRTEVTVGIDGEALNIYDVPTSKLVTSYPVPPQSTFTCPPASTRWRASKSKEVARYTYASTRIPTPRITLFRDVVQVSGKTISKTINQELAISSPIAYISPSPSSHALPLDEEVVHAPNIVAVSQAGEVICLDGETLSEKWRASGDVLSQELRLPKNTSLRVEIAALAPSSEVIDGVFGGKDDAFSAFPQKIEPGVFDPDALIIVTSSTGSQSRTAHFHVLALSPAESSFHQKVIRLHSVPLTLPTDRNSSSLSYSIDIRSGTLLELSGETMFSFDLRSNIPRVQTQLTIPTATSILRLSKTSIIALTPTSFHIYNPLFRSLQASVAHDHAPGGSLLVYFSREETALALLGHDLVAIQLEAPKTKNAKRRAEGLLIDAIGRGVSTPDISLKKAKLDRASAFSSLVPGSVTMHYWDKFETDLKRANSLLASDKLASFEKLLASKFLVKVENVPKEELNGVLDDSEEPLLKWHWPRSRTEYPSVDRRWVLYAINCLFKWVETTKDGFPATTLDCQIPHTNVLNYLVDAGHLTMSNLRAAFRNEESAVGLLDHEIAEELIQQLVAADDSFELLVGYISSTQLGPTELLIAVRAIMGTFTNSDKLENATKLLTNGTAADDAEELDFDTLEAELDKGVSQLDDEVGLRANGLSIAFAKLSSCPALPTIQALRLTYKPDQILSLIIILRGELHQGAWTMRYLEAPPEYDDDESYEPPSDSSIKVLADLLSRCVDSLGATGWVVNDDLLAKDGQDSPGFVSALKLEVRAALEGAQSCIYLRGLIGEVLRYSDRLKKQHTPKSGGSTAPQTIQQAVLAELPLGLKAHERISREKVLRSGEVAARSNRETGHLISKRVESYSLERVDYPS